MQATITYFLTEEAQRAQMAATGQPVARKQLTIVEIAAENLAMMQVSEDGTPYLDLTEGWLHPQTDWLRKAEALSDLEGMRNGSRVSNMYCGFRAANPDVLALMRRGREKIVAEEAAARDEEDAEIRKFLASDTPVTGEYALTHIGHVDIRGRIDALAQEYMAEAKRRYRAHQSAEQAKKMERERIAAEQQAAREASAAIAEQEKQDFIRTWIAANANEETRQQFEDGLLCRKAMLSMIADAAFAQFGVPEAVEIGETCHNRACPCGDSYVDCLPRSIYSAWRPLKAKLPEGTEVRFSKVRDCLKDDEGGYYREDGESAGPAYYTADITMPHGPFKFERRVKL